MNLFKTAILITILSFLSGCSRAPGDRRLLQIDSSISVSPEEAIVELDNIDPSTLREADRHFLDLLTVKARDKAYETHTSDSLILDVVDYYSRSPRSRFYPEALYYAGRVCSDLGDSPSALNFFQEALEAESAGKDDAELRSRILSQTGRLLNSLRLYDEAIPYIKESMEISRNLNDTVGIIQDLQLLGTVCCRAGKLKEAEEYLNKSIEHSKSIDDFEPYISFLYMAGAQYKAGNLQQARTFIRKCLENEEWRNNNTVLAHATDIYFDSEMYDLSFICAKRLVDSPSQSNKETGYAAILSTPLRERLPSDTASLYLDRYLALLESYLDENVNQLAINQQSLHNYTLHDREREKAEKRAERLRLWILGSVGLILLLIVTVLYQKMKSKENIIRLHEVLEEIDRLCHTTDPSDGADEHVKEANPSSMGNTVSIPRNDNETAVELRERLRKKLLKIYDDREGRIILSPIIIDSPAYSRLQELISRMEELREDDPLWREIRDSVLKVSPNFIRHLQLLVGGKLSSYDLQTALLIKFGVQPGQLSKLLNRSKSAIGSRRESLCRRIFDENLGPKVIDGIIRLL